jgi:RNA polymerase sigma factor (sigma-70 family)
VPNVVQFGSMANTFGEQETPQKTLKLIWPHSSVGLLAIPLTASTPNAMQKAVTLGKNDSNSLTLFKNLLWTDPEPLPMAEPNELLLIEQAQKGDRKSLNLMLENYDRLCHKLARKYKFQAKCHDHEDLVQEGKIGLIHGVKTYDPSRGAKPMTWFYFCIRSKINSAGVVDRKQPEFPLSLEDQERAYNVADPSQDIELKEDIPSELVKNLVETCCGGLHTKRAQIVIDRFGLFGKPELRNFECAEKYNLSKYAVTSHTCQFKRKARKNFPHYVEFI